MKKISILMIFTMLMVSFGSARAEVTADSFSFSASAGGFFFEHNQNRKDVPVVGLRAGYNFTEYFAVEGFATYLQSKVLDNGDEPYQNIYGAGIDGLYYLTPKSRFVPYFAVGAGVTHYGYPIEYRGDRFTIDYGAGFKYFLTDDIALRADIRHVLPLNERYNDFLCTVGIDLSLGWLKKETIKAAAAEPQPAQPAPVVLPDSDNDGVPDYLDKCPGTPPNIPVDKNGCPIDMTTDSDRDGVPDYLDKCPGNPASIVVDRNGCPPDSDGDGVPDYLDQCPGTPKGVPVDKKGCPTGMVQDSDKDGVPDNLDKCPGTPRGTLVDRNGCPLPAPAEKKTFSMRLKLEFDSGKSVIKKKYHKDIAKVADFMKNNPTANATIVGHTDSIEKSRKPKKSVQLSKARADSLKLYLVKKFRVKSSRIKTLWYGPDRPVADNDTKEGRQKNRRVVAQFEFSE